MASGGSGIQQQFQQPYQCKECGLSFNSAESLDVHLQYHKENLLKHWAVQAGGSHSSDETNNNMTKSTTTTMIKREFNSNNSDGAEMQKKSPEYNRATPDHIYGHPPTPQSYQSASSPYQNPESAAFSPNFSNFQIKSEAHSPASHYQQNSFSPYADQQFFGVDSNQQQQYQQEVNVNKASGARQTSFRYHPYSTQQPQAQVPASSPAYPPQPTPSPSPKQCDKCGYVCESAAQLIEHNNLSHPSTPQQYPQHFMFDHQQQPSIKTEEDGSQSEILDLDSHKVVHPVWVDGKEDEKRSENPHSVSAMLNSWPQPQGNMFQNDHGVFMNESEPKLFPGLPNIPDGKMFAPNYNSNAVVTSTNQEIGNGLGQNQQTYRPFDHMQPSQASSVISSTPQVPNANGGGAAPAAPPTKSANWKSNEARRPKTYNCTACNKWFTSSGHLKRHYNTTLHKNAVKSSGQPDPASMPISAHHHPTREASSSKEDRSTSGSPREDSRGEDSNNMSSQFDRINLMPGLLQHPPNGPYDRQPSMHHTPPMHSPMAPSPLGTPSPIMNSNFPGIPNGSPPNGEAGLSPNTSLDSRGLLSIGSPHNMAPPPPHGFNMMAHHQTGPMISPMEGNQFQMYPNESAPHVTQATAISSHNTTGEIQFSIDGSAVVVQESQPLPSFAQIQAHRYGVINYGLANVGGGGTATTPYFYAQNDMDESKSLIFRDENTYKLAVLTTNENNMYSSPSNNNNNNDELSLMEPEMNITFDPDDIKFMRKDPLALEPTKKPDYEETSGSPVISSTVNSKEGKTKCFDCDKVFNRPCYLTQHNKTCHNGDKPFKCTRCGKRFSSEEIYKEHASKHAGEKPHKCDVCPKQFNHKTDLRRHMCCHTGRKPYVCETCGKGFIRKDHMMKHMETHVRKAQSKSGAIRS
ncbi:uncharacterized protein LOC132696441 [Cylas formicarius]|uniref:uncharacterized protein LOC132696441 n=1 Tax=Cylas formicarius TaxID=197179 RepID=UPI002958DC42|nr:uncharacterized protein LOC132696441 [Cylas formicarius]